MSVVTLFVEPVLKNSDHQLNDKREELSEIDLEFMTSEVMGQLVQIYV